MRASTPDAKTGRNILGSRFGIACADEIHYLIACIATNSAAQ
jgi:hypothetical protein